jgi:hypothetical protein
MSQLLYAPTIHEAIASGDLARMKQVAAEAEEYLAKAGHLPAALQALKVEIARAERK